MAEEFIEPARRELSAEELAGLRVYHASTDRGSLVTMPVIRGFGREVRWITRLHVKGVSGPVAVNRASLRAIGAPEE